MKGKNMEACRYDIYGIINLVNNKIYIGQTKRGYRHRFAEHLCPSDGSPLLRKAISKYGRSNFECELLDIAYSQDEANEKEKMWICALGTYKHSNGYNLSMGGEIGKFNEDTLKRMSLSHMGEKNHFYGKHHTNEAKKKMSEAKKGLHAGTKHPKARKVKCIETGEIFGTLKEAAEKYNTQGSKIGDVCRGKYGRKTAGGFTWQWI